MTNSETLKNGISLYFSFSPSPFAQLIFTPTTNQLSTAATLKLSTDLGLVKFIAIGALPLPLPLPTQTHKHSLIDAFYFNENFYLMLEGR